MSNHDDGGEDSKKSIGEKDLDVPLEASPRIIVPESPAKGTRSPSEDGTTSLNDDLASVSGINTRPVASSRMSLDSYSVRRSFDSSVMGRHSRSFGFDNESHSGSMEFSPLGNNSIYEIVMNTRRKDWLAYPTVIDIPPVALSKNVIEDSYKKAARQYVKEIRHESSVFESTNNLRSMTRMEQLRQLEKYDNPTQDFANEDEKEFVNRENLKELEDVPSFYFEKDFQLDNPRTFHRVLKDIDLQLNKLNEEDQVQRDEAQMELKERLNYYLDAVEGLLVAEISKSSHKFFHALADVDLIQQKAEGTVMELDRLAEATEFIDKEKIQKRIGDLEKIFKRKNVQKIEQALLQVKLVTSRTQECQQLYGNGGFEKCLDLIGSIDFLIKGDDSQDTVVQGWVSDWPYKLVNLKSVPALAGTRELVTNLKIEIGGKFSLQLCDLLLRDVREYCEPISAIETLSRFQNITREKPFLETNPLFTSSITELIHQLRRCEELASSFSLYQDKCVAEIKNIIKMFLPQEQQANDEPPRSQQSISSGSKLSRLIKEQTPVEFQDMLVSIFTRSSEALRRFCMHQKLLLDLALSEITSSTTTAEFNENHQAMITQLDIRFGINEAIRILQLRMGKIIAVRRETTATLRYDHFLKLYSICVLFIQECEAMSGEFLTKYLSDVLAAQIKNYISAQGSKNLRTIQSKIDAEKWTPSIVNRNVQKDVNDIVASMDLDPLDWVQLSDLVQQSSAPEEDQLATPNQAGHRKSVVVGDKTFVASDALLSCIYLVKVILILSTNLPAAYLSSFEKMCYDLLKHFNVCAINSVTQPDKTLSKTGKNLSIMGESLDCLAELLQIVQQFFQRMQSFSRDFTPADQPNYAQLLQQYRGSTDKIYQSNVPPPPV